MLLISSDVAPRQGFIQSICPIKYIEGLLFRLYTLLNQIFKRITLKEDNMDFFKKKRASLNLIYI